MTATIIDARHFATRRCIAQWRESLLASARASDCPHAAAAYRAAADGRFADARCELNDALERDRHPQRRELLVQLHQLLHRLDDDVDTRLRRAWDCQREARDWRLRAESERVEQALIDEHQRALSERA